MYSTECLYLYSCFGPFDVLSAACGLLAYALFGLLLQIEGLEQKLSVHLNKLYEARRRRTMYLGFAEAPVAFINAAIASQVSKLSGFLQCLVLSCLHGPEADICRGLMYVHWL